jgi:hypothetical protein
MLSEALGIVHETFSHVATLTPAGGLSAPVDLTARLTVSMAQYGDLDREGYSQVLGDDVTIILLQSEYSDRPTRGDMLDLGDWGRWRVEALEPRRNPVEWHVHCVRAPA